MLYKRFVDYIVGLLMPIVRAIARLGFYSEDQYTNSCHDLQIGWLHFVTGYQGGYFDCCYARIYYDAGDHIKNIFLWDDNYPDPWHKLKIDIRELPYTLLYEPVIALIGQLVIFGGNLRDPKAGHDYYMQMRVISTVKEHLSAEEN